MFNKMKAINDQLIFNLNRKGNAGLENFYISKSNHLAVSTIKNCENWPAKKLLLMGPTGSGKSHLAEFWAEKTRALIISMSDIFNSDIIELSQYAGLLLDNVDDLKLLDPVEKVIIEEKLFHLLNSTSQSSCYFLMTSSSNILSWGLKLKDLISRLETIAVAELLTPDDELLVAVLLKQFDDRQIKVSPEFVLFVSKRINRSFNSISEFVNLIDYLTLKRKKEVTIPIASQLLDSLDKSNNTDVLNDDFDSFLERSGLVG